ncbi:MAG TPA: hypothetical protein VHB30_00870 [Solirubrobacteraceae bacterium]|nr:hypothetical protein [Solirubrobacteraceae bacterium]
MHHVLFGTGHHQGGVLGIVAIVAMLALRGSRIYARTRTRRRPGDRDRWLR